MWIVLLALRLIRLKLGESRAYYAFDVCQLAPARRHFEVQILDFEYSCVILDYLPLKVCCGVESEREFGTPSLDLASRFDACVLVATVFAQERFQ